MGLSKAVSCNMMEVLGWQRYSEHGCELQEA